MKKSGFFWVTGIFALIILASSYYQSDYQNKINVQNKPGNYQDGIYTGLSRSHYLEEPYWGIISIKIEKGTFTAINFMIRDSNLHETFTLKYKKHFKGNPEYIQQCKNDWKGVQIYPKTLKKAQDINKIDALTGATWSYNIFKASAEEALKKAVK